MELNFFLFAVGILLFFAVMDLIVGVSNDAVNFLNSSIGSKVAPRYIIMIVASFGIIAGVMFSSGMMEVARKGIFHPQFFTMPELINIFLGVMLADVLILDLFNTFGLPTSTTVSIVFELLGAAVAVSALKLLEAGQTIFEIGQYINTGRAMMIVFGILLSVMVAFICGGIVQFFTRMVFTFDYKSRLRRYGGLWGGLALATIVLFILVKGAKGASFITPETAAWIKSEIWMIHFGCFLVFAAFFQILLTFFNVNILKPIVLMGTFALALAFAANDLVNFIGVPLAGLQSYKTAMLTADPLNATMEALTGKLQSESYYLIVAGLIMVVTLWLSRKAKTVSQTELSLGRQEEGLEKFESVALSRVVVRMASSFFETVKTVFPASVRKAVNKRFERDEDLEIKDEAPSFDLLRASVNLMVASAVVSFATSLKLPLSTTYVTFMVSMGSSFADQAWGRESAVYRVTGVLAVIGGWFMTAFMAFSTAFIFAIVLFYGGALGTIALLILCAFTIWKSHHTHKSRKKESEDAEVFNLKKITDAPAAITTTFEHTALLLKEIRESLDGALEALFTQDLYRLKHHRRLAKKIQTWSNIIAANIFKAMRLLQKEDVAARCKYSLTLRCLQSLSESHRDLVIRSYLHIDQHHKGLLPVQILELKELKECITDMLFSVEKIISNGSPELIEKVIEKNKELEKLTENFNPEQMERTRKRESKTRLTILYYAITGDIKRIARQNLRLLETFQESFDLGKTKS